MRPTVERCSACSDVPSSTPGTTLFISHLCHSTGLHFHGRRGGWTSSATPSLQWTLESRILPLSIVPVIPGRGNWMSTLQRNKRNGRRDWLSTTPGWLVHDHLWAGIVHKSVALLWLPKERTPYTNWCDLLIRYVSCLILECMHAHTPNTHTRAHPDSTL